jgi:uncharacterized protein YkwD
MFKLVNRDRAAAGLRPLKWHGKLAAVARAHSADMASTGVVAHGSSRTGMLDDRLAKVGLTKLPFIAENVGQAASVAQMQRGFMTSPGHRGNVLAPHPTHVGVGIVVARAELGGLTLYVTQVFASGL